jgi:drug/metabolite transporter (DMT)-like permease
MERQYRLLALASATLAVVIWSSLAALTVSLNGVPPLQVTGLALAIGGSLSIPWWRKWKLERKSVALGCYGFFLYHVLFIMALRWAPAVQANLVRYVWPTLIVLLSPLLIPSVKLHARHYVAASMGVTGAALAILGGGASGVSWAPGYVLALAAAIVWSTYSLLLCRVPTANAATTGLCCLASGAMALLAQAGLASFIPMSQSQWLTLMALGAGPMGGAFYLWNFALRKGDSRVIGTLANATPVLSTIVLSATVGQILSLRLFVSLGLVVGAGLVLLAPRTARSNRNGSIACEPTSGAGTFLENVQAIRGSSSPGDDLVKSRQRAVRNGKLLDKLFRDVAMTASDGAHRPHQQRTRI